MEDISDYRRLEHVKIEIKNLNAHTVHLNFLIVHHYLNLKAHKYIFYDVFNIDNNGQ